MNLARSGELACKVQNETRSLRTLGRTVSVAVIVADASLSYGVCGTAMPSLLGGVVLLLSPPELLSFFFILLFVTRCTVLPAVGSDVCVFTSSLSLRLRVLLSGALKKILTATARKKGEKWLQISEV